jgi:aquaporin Z
MEYALSRRLTVEFIGQFLFVFVVGLATESLNRGGAVFAPFAIGGVLAVIVYAGGYISGGHYNPAVSTAVMVRGKLPPQEWAAYVATQLIAAVLSALLVKAIGGAQHVGTFANDGKMIVVEFLFTFLLGTVVLNTATSKGTEGNSFYGLAIGGTVVVGAIAVGWISGAAFNPAIALGASIFGALPWSHIWIYFIFDLIGGAAAGAVFLFIQGEHARA